MMHLSFLVLAAVAALGPVSDETLPAFIGAPADSYYDVTNRGLVGVASCAVAPNGRLWATWYTGPTHNPDEANYLVLTTSADGGATWQEVCIVDPDREGPRRVFDPELWVAPDGTMRWTWTDRRGHELSDPSKDGFWMMTIADPNEVPSRWPVPRLVSNGVGIVKATAWTTGEWIWPVVLWQGAPSTRLLTTTDGGKTFSIAGGITLPKELRYFDETVVTEKRNGDLWAFIRTKNVAHECFSKDRGKTWSDVKPARIAQLSARTCIVRLKSGNLLLVKHGRAVGKRTPSRTDLTAFLSRDDGDTWEGGLLIDGRERVAYPDAVQSADGTIHLVYDRDRQSDREILMAHFTEADVLARKGVSAVFTLRQTVSRSSVPGGASDNLLLSTDETSLAQTRAVTLPPIFGDHAVLHRGPATAVWGEAAPGERVTVLLDGASATAVADKDGWWTVHLDLRKCGEGPFELRAKGVKGEAVAKDVLVGEVWLASGQSNMELPFHSKLFGMVFDAEDLWKRAAGRPIRVFHKDRCWETSRQMKNQNGWWICPEPQALSNCSAVAFSFAERLQRTVGGPVAVVDLAFGGTRVMQWTDHEKLLDRPHWYAHWTNQVEQFARQREASRWIDANKCREGRFPAADAVWEKNVRLPEKLDRGVTWYRKRFPVPKELETSPVATIFAIDGFRAKRAVVTWFVGQTGWVDEQRCFDGELKDLRAGQRWRDEAVKTIRDGQLELVLRFEAKLPEGVVAYERPHFGRRGEAGFDLGLDGWEKCVTATYPPLVGNEPFPLPYAMPAEKMEHFYNSMVWPFRALTFRGMIWLQGCEDAKGTGITASYRSDLATMVANWRETFGNPAAPFYCAQLTGFGRLQQRPSEESPHNEIRDAHRQLPRICPNSWTAICHDLGEGECHGREKIPVGVRLAEIALARDYGRKDLCWRSADYREMTVDGAVATLRFETWGSPLVARPVRTEYSQNRNHPHVPVTRHSPASQLEGFAVCDDAGVWHWADAEISGPDTVRVTAKGVNAIRRVRYDWGGVSVGNLWNAGGLPVSCFDTAGDLPATRDLRYFNVVPILDGDVEFAVREVKRQRALGMKAVAVCLSYHPQCTPAKDLLPVHASNFRKLKALLAETDVEVGVLVQSTAGHGWNGRMELSKETWQRAVNVDGKVHPRWCQLDPGFRAYVLEAVRSISEEGPSFLLIDDDFGPKCGEGFCPLHVALYNRATGETRTCDEWCKLANEGALEDPVRRKMEEARRQVPIAFARDIRAAIDSVDPKIRCGMCTPGKGMGFTKDVALALAGPNTKPFIRICNQVYGMVHPADFINQLQHVRQLTDMFEGVEELVAEADTWPQNHWSTPARYFGTQLIYDVLFGLDGAKIWMSEFERNEDVRSQARFEKVFKDELPKRQALYDLMVTKRPRFHGVTGILNWGDWSADSVRGGAMDNGSPVRAVFQPFGFPCEFAKAKSKDPRDVYALTRNSVRMMTDEEIRLVLSHRAYVDSAGAKELTKRGFAGLLGVEATDGDAGFFFNRELSKDGSKPLLINWDATAACLKPLSAEAEVLSEFAYRDPTMAADAVKAPGLVYFRNRLGGEVAVSGWTFEHTGGYMPWNKYLRVNRKEQLVKVIDRLAGGLMPFVAAENNHAMVSWASLADGSTLLVVTNLAVDDWQDLRVRLDTAPVSAKLLMDDGTWRTVVAEKTGEREVTFRVGKVACLVPQILLLEKMEETK